MLVGILLNEMANAEAFPRDYAMNASELRCVAFVPKFSMSSRIRAKEIATRNLLSKFRFRIFPIKQF
jgi:hypothetical protein